jgi:hypothetical protein
MSESGVFWILLAMVIVFACAQSCSGECVRVRAHQECGE